MDSPALLLLSRESVLVRSSTDLLTKLPDEIRLSAPHYFLNVPTLLERVRRGVEDALSKRACRSDPLLLFTRRRAKPGEASRVRRATRVA